MRYLRTLAFSLILGGISLNAQAALTRYSSQGVELVYSSLGDVTWTRDGNLFGTLATQYAAAHGGDVGGLIADIKNANVYDGRPGLIYHPYYGGRPLVDADFVSDGRLSWWGAQAFVTYLNAIDYAGSKQWRLPGIVDTGEPGCVFARAGGDCGYNIDTSTGELGRLYYDELGLKARVSPAPWIIVDEGTGIFGNYGVQTESGDVGLFTNARSYGYWSDNELVRYEIGYAWMFYAEYGYQHYEDKKVPFYAWIVSSGQLAAVPLPGTVWLMSSGLLGMLGLKRRRALMCG